MNTQSKNSVIPVGCTLNIKQVAPSLDLATHIASQGFCVNDSPELRADVEKHLTGGQVVCEIELSYDFGSREVVYEQIWRDRPERHDQQLSKWTEKIGFAIFNLYGERILYLSGIILSPEYQGKGIAVSIVRWAMKEFGREILVLRTQSPRMWSAMKKMCYIQSPEIYTNDQSWDKQYGKQVAECIGSEYPVHKGCYGGPLYGVKPTHHDPKIQKWWDSICSFERGDAVICVGALHKG